MSVVEDGVMNTDNMSILGYTIDFGPMDGWNPMIHNGPQTQLISTEEDMPTGDSQR